MSIMRGRCGIDLGDITTEYPKHHKQQLEDRFQEKRVGYIYKKALEAMVLSSRKQTEEMDYPYNKQMDRAPSRQYSRTMG